MIRRPKFLLVLSVLAITALVGACGSSSSSSSSSTTTTAASSSTTAAASSGTASSGTTPTSAAASGTPITIGVICSCTGALDQGNGGPEVYEAWADSVNASGGLDGHQIKLIVKDDATTPATSISEVDGFISDHVNAIMDDSGVDQTWASAVKAAGIPVVGASVSEPPFYDNSDFYSVGQTNDDNIYSILATAKAAGAKVFSDVYCAEVAICAESAPLFKTVGAPLGEPDVYNVAVSATAPSYASQCIGAKQLNVTAMFIGDAYQVVDRIAADCKQQGFQPIYLQDAEGYSAAELTSPGINVDTLEVFPNLPYYAPAYSAMNAAINKYFPGLLTSPLFSQAAAQSWPSGLLLADAVKAGGGITPADIINGLDSLKGDTLGGLSPPLTFVAGKTHSVDCWFVGAIVNGKATIGNGGKVECGGPGA